MELKVGDKVVAEIVEVDSRDRDFPIAISSVNSDAMHWVHRDDVACFRPLPDPLTPLERAVVEKARKQEAAGQQWARAMKGPDQSHHEDAYRGACGETNAAVRALIAAETPPSEPPTAWVPKVGDRVRVRDCAFGRFTGHEGVVVKDVKFGCVLVEVDGENTHFTISRLEPIPAPDLSALRDAVVAEFDKFIMDGDTRFPGMGWGERLRPAVDALRALRAAMAPHAPPDPVEELREAAKALHDDVADYQRINHLGGYDNHCMRRLRAALAALDKKDGAP